MKKHTYIRRGRGFPAIELDDFVYIGVPDKIYLDYIYVVRLTKEEAAQLESGKLIQDAVPGLHPDARELFVSGETPAQFDDLFGKLEGVASYDHGNSKYIPKANLTTLTDLPKHFL